MTKRRSRGDGGLYWDDKRKRWIASVTVGYTIAGKRIVRRGSGRTKTAALDRLKEILRDYDDGLSVGPQDYTVTNAVTAWLANGLNGRSSDTVGNYALLANKHVIPAIGRIKLRHLSADDVDKWLNSKARDLSTRTIRLLHSILNRCVRHAQARDKVKRNVVGLCQPPEGRRLGRRSKALTVAEATAVLDAAKASSLHAYIVLSLMTGARTEELRALEWQHVVAYVKERDTWEPVAEAGWNHKDFGIEVWHSVRAGGDTKTKKSRRTLALPARAVDALAQHEKRQNDQRVQAGGRWHEHGLVFASAVGTVLDAHNVRRGFRLVAKRAGLNPRDWTPREMRHSFVSILSDAGVRSEDIGLLVGHSDTSTTERVYRLQLRPVMQKGTAAMNRIFAGD